jgi:hypothetical protein
MSTEDLLKLPWDVQLPLASGYAAYVLAYTGLRDRQKTVDIAFISLVFSLIATAVLYVATQNSVSAIKASVAAFVITVLCGVAWRKWGRPLVGWALRQFDVAWSNDDPSALATISGSTKFFVTTVAVHLDDGTWMSCEDASAFNESPFGPYILGPNGDIAFYVTDISPVQGDARPQTTVRNASYGDRITYLPASRIKAITIRHLAKPSRASRAAASADPSPLEQEGPLAAP